jgi:hypothetical protein
VLVIRPSICLTASVAAMLFGGACARGDCTTDSRAGLFVTVVDALGTSVCDASVTATERGFSEVLRSSLASAPQPCSYAGVYERPGTYTVTATANGQRGVVSSLRVVEGACHVKLVSTTITLGSASG